MRDLNLVPRFIHDVILPDGSLMRHRAVENFQAIVWTRTMEGYYRILSACDTLADAEEAAASAQARTSSPVAKYGAAAIVVITPEAEAEVEALAAQIYALRRQRQEATEPIGSDLLTAEIKALETERNLLRRGGRQPAPATYTYRLRSRPPMYGTVPEGHIALADEHPSSANDHTFGSVSYAQPLTPRQVYKYELLPDFDIPMPMYPVGTKLREMKTGKVFEVEFDHGDFWVGDEPLRFVRDWLAFEPVEATK